MAVLDSDPLYQTVSMEDTMMLLSQTFEYREGVTIDLGPLES
jgi:hypothetical protein